MSSRQFFDAADVLKKFGDLNGKTILDIGCGDGHFSIVASKLVGETGKVIVIDIDKPSIDRLHEKINNQQLKNIETILQDFSKDNSLANNSVDICLMVNVFHGFVINHESDNVLCEI